MPDFFIKQSDLLPTLAVVLSDADGPISLADVTSIAFSMRQVGGAVIIDQKEAAPDVDQDNNPGLCRYFWDTGDTDIAGLFNAEFKATWADDKPRRFPNDKNLTVKIGDKVA